jgi:SAM-dependent methyltransferase
LDGPLLLSGKALPDGSGAATIAGVGFYSRTVFPRLCDLFLGQPFLAPYRRELLAPVGDTILEIGFGTGLNLPHYPRHVRQITAVDPNPGMVRRARRRIRQSGIEVVHRPLDGERLPLETGTFDWVVSSWTLCSIADVGRAVAEVYRVLKPGGGFVFLEHGLSREPGVQKWQRRLNWLEIRLAGGCRLDRDMKAIVTAPPFASVNTAEFYLPNVLRTHGYMYRGLAVK